MKKECPRCSTNFLCREDRTDLCRCSRTHMVPGAKDYAKLNYKGCLCPSCLQEISKSYNAFGVNPKYKLSLDI